MTLAAQPDLIADQPATTRPASRGSYFSVAHSLRGFAALWVVLFHAEEGHHVTALLAALPLWIGDLLFRAGHFGVPIFFALSGLVIAHSVRDTVFTGRSYGRFILRRSFRLDPPYWAAIALVALTALAEGWLRHQPAELPTAGQVLAHVTYLQVLLGVAPISPVFWTLAYEFQFYLFFAGCLTLAGYAPALRKPIWLAMYGLALLSAAGLAGSTPGLFTGMWASFFAGVLAYHAISEPRARLAALPLAAAVLFHGDPVATASLLAGLFLWATSGLSANPLRWLGTISYSLYLIHNPVTGASAFVSRKLFGESSIASDLATLAAIVGASLAVAGLFWWGIERPSQRLAQRVRK